MLFKKIFLARFIRDLYVSVCFDLYKALHRRGLHF